MSRRSIAVFFVGVVLVGCFACSEAFAQFHPMHGGHPAFRSPSNGFGAVGYPPSYSGAIGYGHPSWLERGDSRYGYGYPSPPIRVYGSGYVYDPYERGSFNAPDLLDDPYFREQTRYNSHFPGRDSGRPPLELRYPERYMEPSPTRMRRSRFGH